MVKKYSKDTFRHTKKNLLHKKRVNTKKRGLRGGAIDTRAIIDEQGLHGITKQFTFSREKDLTHEVCEDWFTKIYGLDDETIKKAFKLDGTLKTTSTGHKDYRICSRKLNDTSIEQFNQIMEQAKKQGEKVSSTITSLSQSDSSEVKELFDTKLDTNTNQKDNEDEPLYVEGKYAYVGLTLDKCVAKKNPYRVSGEQTLYFEYSIFSPTETTEPPNSGSQGETLVGTFTQLPVSVLLQVAGETPFSYGSFYGANEERKPYFMDYLSCLENVKQQFGPSVDMKSSQSQQFRSNESSKLCQFGKSKECKIFIVAGNVGTEIQTPYNDGAIFVLPSQLNGAEYKFPAQAKKITLGDYKDDPTAGPLGQLSFHPGVAQFVLDHAARTDFSSDFLVINAIDNVISELLTLGITSLTLNNGYLEVPAKLNSGVELELKDGENPSQNAIAIFDSLSTRLKVLQTYDVPTSGLTPPGEYTEFNSKSITKATPIYASAVPLKYGLNINPEKSTLQYCVAGFDLVAQYFGAMVSAMVSAYSKSKNSGEDLGNKVKLFLTPLGGGVFNNPREMIACSVLLAYYQAQQLFSDFDAKVEVIFLVWDGNPYEGSDFGNFFNKQQGDKLYEKYKYSSEEDKVADAESYRNGVLEKFKSEESYYDDVFSKLPEMDEYSPALVTSAIVTNEKLKLFDKLMNLLSLTRSADLREKLYFIKNIFLKCPDANKTSCSNIETIISCLTINLPILTPSVTPSVTPSGGSKSRRRRRHRRHARKTRRGRIRKSKAKAKAKSKTHRHRRVHKNKKYTRKR